MYEVADGMGAILGRAGLFGSGGVAAEDKAADLSQPGGAEKVLSRWQWLLPRRLRKLLPRRRRTLLEPRRGLQSLQPASSAVQLQRWLVQATKLRLSRPPSRRGRAGVKQL